MLKFKDCPFCGSRSQIEGLKVMEEMDGETTRIFVECSRCKARGPVKVARFDLPATVKIEAAALIWNSRRELATKQLTHDLATMEARRGWMHKKERRKGGSGHGMETI